MFTGFNIKKARKQSRIEKLEVEVKRLQKLLGTMMHLHERLKNERTQTSETAKLPTLSSETPIDSKSTKDAPTIVFKDAIGEPTPGTNKEGA